MSPLKKTTAPRTELEAAGRQTEPAPGNTRGLPTPGAVRNVHAVFWGDRGYKLLILLNEGLIFVTK